VPIKRIFMAGIGVFLCSTLNICLAKEVAKTEEKSDLAKLYEKIDKHYKTVEELSGYYKYNDSDWDTISGASDNIIKLSRIIINKFSRPEDIKYEELNKAMLKEAEKMHAVAENKYEEGALEDIQWQVRKLQQTCAVCHKHLGIQVNSSDKKD